MGREIAAVILAGIAGTLVNALAAGLVVSADIVHLVSVPGRYGVAIVVAALLPALWRAMGRAGAVVAGLVLLAVIPSLLAKLVFGAGLAWGLVLLLNLFYAGGAVVTYVLVARPQHRSDGAISRG